jgi:hypothetical protein
LKNVTLAGSWQSPAGLWMTRCCLIDSVNRLTGPSFPINWVATLSATASGLRPAPRSPTLFGGCVQHLRLLPPSFRHGGHLLAFSTRGAFMVHSPPQADDAYHRRRLQLTGVAASSGACAFANRSARVCRSIWRRTGRPQRRAPQTKPLDTKRLIQRGRARRAVRRAHRSRRMKFGGAPLKTFGVSIDRLSQEHCAGDLWLQPFLAGMGFKRQRDNHKRPGQQRHLGDDVHRTGALLWALFRGPGL